MYIYWHVWKGPVNWNMPQGCATRLLTRKISVGTPTGENQAGRKALTSLPTDRDTSRQAPCFQLVVGDHSAPRLPGTAIALPWGVEPEHKLARQAALRPIPPLRFTPNPKEKEI